MEIAGLPLHPLVVHATVVLTPLAVLLGWAFAALPAWRWLTRWAALLTTLGAAVAVVAARVTGRSMLDARPFLTQAGTPIAERIQTHQDRAFVLLWVTVAYAVVVVLAFLLLPAVSGLASGRGAHAGNAERWVALVVPATLVVLGLVVLVWVFLTGDAGARAVWGK